MSGYPCPHLKTELHRDGSIHCGTCSAEWPSAAALDAELTGRAAASLTDRMENPS